MIEDVAGLRPRNDATGRAVADQHRLVALRGEQPPLPQHATSRSSGTTRPTASPATPACRRATRSTSTAAARSPSTSWSRCVYDPATGAVTLPSGGTVDLQHRRLRACRRRSRSCRTARAWSTCFAKAGVDLTSTRPTSPRAPPSRPRTPRRARRPARRSTASRSTNRSGAVPARPTARTGTRSTSGRRGRSTRCGCTSATTAPATATERRRRTTVQYYERQRLGRTSPRRSRRPATPQANYNVVRFTPVGTQRMRVLMTHAAGLQDRADRGESAPKMSRRM